MEKTFKMLQFLIDDDSDDEKMVNLVSSMGEEEVEGEASSSRVPRSRIYIPRDRESAADRLFNDYFADSPVYPKNKFKRRFRMSRQLFLRIVEGISNFNCSDIPEYFMYFRERPDAAGRQSLTILQKCTAAIRQMAYGTTPDMFDEYIKIGEKTAALCLDYFCKCVFHLFAREYLRKPTTKDIARLYNFHAQKHGLPGMLGSIDCMHWEWKNCPVEWQGQYTRGDKKGPSIMLEAVASQDLWIWHGFFGMAGANNDINVLNASPLFNSIKDGTAPPSPFDVNGHHYDRGYYLGDGIYPDWAMLVKAPHSPIGEPRKKFKRFQESARKDIERAFGVLQGRFAMLKTPARSLDFNKIRRHMYACLVLHNMIQENNGFVIGRREERMIERNPPRRLQRDLRDRDARVKEIRDRQVHIQLEADLTEHVWNLSPYFRTANDE
ncbi:protein ALP1-like [Rutidosis leptorrhynchoides]|uniref:protein ALP1-like n=1 Tax=Rutidosis leptorrhynchoides TaxID=125765 RepID=UPI003A99482C